MHTVVAKKITHSRCWVCFMMPLGHPKIKSKFEKYSHHGD